MAISEKDCQSKQLRNFTSGFSVNNPDEFQTLPNFKIANHYSVISIRWVARSLFPSVNRIL